MGYALTLVNAQPQYEGGIVLKFDYEVLRAELVRYAGPEEGQRFTLEGFTDGVLERLVIAGIVDPERIEGWPADGMVFPLLSEVRGA